MKAATLSTILHRQAAFWQQRGNALEADEDQAPYMIADAFTQVANELDMLEAEEAVTA